MLFHRYSRRQELKKLQAQRGIGSNELSSIMKTIGASTDADAHKEQSPAEKQAELDAFDQKIYRAQCQMNEAMAAQLKMLGVPFFGTSPDRLVADDDDVNPDVDRSVDPKWSPRIRHSELHALQRRMISYLEDMYKD
ncbi:hypothetical protein K461DRAFT_278083 [Myriangium duriaei CBS 260.36]|uniref:Uncharacterized protein n=1 Tax=Myriangium duriaei CBS 260.36 TaxID=1168546 RepID=A0A9P4MKL0_9PEZI|nr:hypothetical protein K461DRAFT_278083 [Myriangium duriaei CBS 260.36]